MDFGIYGDSGTGTVYCFTKDGDSNMATVALAPLTPTGSSELSSYTCTLDGTHMRSYLNGVFVNEDSVAAAIPSGSTPNSRVILGEAAPVVMNIASAYFYNEPLGAAEIQALSDAMFADASFFPPGDPSTTTTQTNACHHSANVSAPAPHGHFASGSQSHVCKQGVTPPEATCASTGSVDQVPAGTTGNAWEGIGAPWSTFAQNFTGPSDSPPLGGQQNGAGGRLSPSDLGSGSSGAPQQRDVSFQESGTIRSCLVFVLALHLLRGCTSRILGCA